MKENLLKIKNLFYIIVGAAINAFATATLLSPNKIVPGGVTGIAIILNQTLEIPLGITIAVVNVVLLLLGVYILGKEFTIKTLFVVGLLSLFVELFSNIPPLTDNIFLASLFGGVIYGTGSAIALIAGASTGGVEILGRMLQHFSPQFPIGKLLLCANAVIITTSLLIFKDVELVMFTILSLFFATFAIDWLIRKLNVSRIAFVITEKGDEVSQHLIENLNRGVTSIKAVGVYSHQKRSMLFCALKKNEVTQFQKRILEIDDQAFIVYSESSEIKGKGFYIYR